MLTLGYKFKMWDWDSGEFVVIPTNDIVAAIYYAWNYEFNVYCVATETLIFSGQEDNDLNSELLEEYGLRVVDGDWFRYLQNIETGEIYKSEWQREM